MLQQPEGYFFIGFRVSYHEITQPPAAKTLLKKGSGLPKLFMSDTLVCYSKAPFSRISPGISKKNVTKCYSNCYFPVVMRETKKPKVRFDGSSNILASKLLYVPGLEPRTFKRPPVGGGHYMAVMNNMLYIFQVTTVRWLFFKLVLKKNFIKAR